MTGLFLRYCAPCNSTTPCAERGLKCAECGGPLKIVDAFALIPALGGLAGEDKRCIAVAGLEGHDLPKA
jgi:hypothetical protein